jgi:hypothetical protein
VQPSRSQPFAPGGFRPTPSRLMQVAAEVAGWSSAGGQGSLADLRAGSDNARLGLGAHRRQDVASWPAGRPPSRALFGKRSSECRYQTGIPRTHVLFYRTEPQGGHRWARQRR